MFRKQTGKILQELEQIIQSSACFFHNYFLHDIISDIRQIDKSVCLFAHQSIIFCNEWMYLRISYYMLLFSHNNGTKLLHLAQIHCSFCPIQLVKSYSLDCVGYWSSYHLRKNNTVFYNPNKRIKAERLNHFKHFTWFANNEQRNIVYGKFTDVK